MEKKGKSGHEQRWYVNVEEQQYGKGRLEAGVEDVKRGGGRTRESSGIGRNWELGLGLLDGDSGILGFGDVVC